MRNDSKENSGPENLHKPYQKAVHPTENLDEDSDQALKETGRKFLRFCSLNGGAEAFLLGPTCPHCVTQ